jgi:hypothetical protein
MFSYLNKDQLDLLKLKIVRPDIVNLDDLKMELELEFTNMFIFAEKNTIINFRNFINKPNFNTYIKTVNSMRRELWTGDIKFSK